MDYETLTPAERIAIARDRLHGLESDHYRLSLSAGSDSEKAMIVNLAAQIKTVRDILDPLESAAPAA